MTFELPPDALAVREGDGAGTILGNDGQQAGAVNRFVDGETDHSLYRDRCNDGLRAHATAVNDVEWIERLADEYQFDDREDLRAVKRLFASYANAGASLRGSLTCIERRP